MQVAATQPRMDGADSLKVIRHPCLFFAQVPAVRPTFEKMQK
jgi:hypothetical protein